MTTHVYGDNEAEAGNKTEEDAIVYYRRYGYYPSWYHGHLRTTTTTHVYGDNESPAADAKSDNKTEEDALVFYRRYGYYPAWYHGVHKTVVHHYDNEEAADKNIADYDITPYEASIAGIQRYGAPHTVVHHTVGYYDNEQQEDAAAKKEANAVAAFL